MPRTVPRPWIALTILVLLPTLAEAEIRMRLREDGTLVVYNVGPTPRRAQERLVGVPVASWRGWIDEHARRQRLDSKLVRAVIQVESSYDPQAISRKGALGLMQLMPETARQLRVEDPFDPQENIRGGTRYLRQMLDRFGRLELALAAYNAGPSAVMRHGDVPPFSETRRYVDRVLSLYRGGDPLSFTPGRPASPNTLRIEIGPNQQVLVTSTPAGG